MHTNSVKNVIRTHVSINNPNLLHSYETSDSILSDHKIVECATTYNTSFSEKARTEAPREKESEENFENLNFFND